MAVWYVWRAALAASVGAAITGLHVGSINGMFEMQGFRGVFSENFEQSDLCSVDPEKGTLYSEFANVTAACGICAPSGGCGGTGTQAGAVLGLMVSIPLIFAVFGSLFGAGTSNAFGRKTLLSFSGWIMALGGLLSAASFHSWLFIMGRGISGFSMGLIYAVVGSYISEISPKKSRGRLASLIGPIYGLFLVVQFSANCGFSQFCDGWRTSLAVQIVGGATYGLLAMLMIPRTPRWLILHNRMNEAHTILSRINGAPPDDVNTLSELKELQSTTSKLYTNICKDISQQLQLSIRWKYFSRLLLSCFLQVFNPVLGNFTVFYGTTFFCKLNITGCVPNIIIGVCFLVGGSLTSVVIDKVGRKVIFLVGSLVMLTLEGVMAALIQIFNLEEEVDVIVGYIFTILLCTFSFIYAGSWYTTPWVYSSEIFPLEARGSLVAISSGIQFISAAVITQIASIFFSSSLGVLGFMYLIIGFTAISFFFVFLTIPETKGVSLERMDMLFEKSWMERVNIKYYLSCGIISLFQKDKPHKLDSKLPEDNTVATRIELSSPVNTDTFLY